jgi:protein-disulfide isomerase
MRSRALAFFAVVLALIGLGASVASLFDYLAPAPQFCAEAGCATVRASAWSHPLGVPLPAIGIAYFLAMTVLGFWSRRRTRLVLAGVGAAAGIGLILLQALAIGAWCKLCLIADPAAILGGLVVIAGAGTLRPSLPNIVATVPAAALVVLGLGLYAHREEPVAVAASEPLPASVAKEQKPGQVTIVEFVDFECPFCRALDKKLREALARADRPVHIVRKMVPLPMHYYAVPAAMAWCSADAQGKGEEMAKELFAARPEDMTPAGCEAIAVRLGCDVTKYRETLASPELRARIEQDVADAHAAKLNGFPTIFIGKQKFEGAGHSADTLLAAIERAGR